MQAIINPGNISGHIEAPASKSMMQRACAAALLHTGLTSIKHAGDSNDEKAAVQIIQQLGATVITQAKDLLEIDSKGVNSISNYIDCGESGLAARLFTPIAALNEQALHINGHGSLLKRPMNAFDDVLPKLGVQLENFNGQIPFTVRGPLKAQNVEIDGSGSSQFLSGILFALSYAAKTPVTVHVKNLKSKPYIDLTLEVLQHFGRPILHENYRSFYIDPAQFRSKDNVEITIEGDWSSAAYWLVAGAEHGGVCISGLNFKSTQADRMLLNVLAEANANVSCKDDVIEMNASRLTAFECNAIDCPDLFPALAILASCCEGESYIYGLHRLFDKESNRVESIGEMLWQFEVPFCMEDDMLSIIGVKQTERGTIDAYNDHRIVMAAAIGALRANGPVTINGAEAVSKSYPDFFKHLNDLGVQFTLNTE